MRKVHGIALAALLAGVGLFPGMGATSMVRLSMEQLSRGAETIVLGTVTNQVSAWNDQHTSIYTDVTVAVEEAIKGSPGEAVTFRVTGGVVGDMGMRTSVDPVFKDGERVIVLLHTEDSTARVLGQEQGKFTVSNGMVTHRGQAVPLADFINAIRVASR
ncbi:MAG TPA: hypothetical protein VHN13_21445 [Candidatus Tectomicrobia bacterium]|jgi:hypothetical protein|nr:hypothetical protein [Candidatus Tectomicrobia bacterium]